MDSDGNWDFIYFIYLFKKYLLKFLCVCFFFRKDRLRSEKEVKTGSNSPPLTRVARTRLGTRLLNLSFQPLIMAKTFFK